MRSLKYYNGYLVKKLLTKVEEIKRITYGEGSRVGKFSDGQQNDEGHAHFHFHDFLVCIISPSARRKSAAVNLYEKDENQPLLLGIWQRTKYF